MWKGIFKHSRWSIRERCIVKMAPNRVWCMQMRSFLPNSFKLLKMWEKVSIMSMLSTYDTWMVGPDLWISWGSRVVVPLLLLRRGCWIMVPI